MVIDLKGSPRKLRQFADTMAAALREAGETRPIRYDPAAFALRVGEPADGGRVEPLERWYRRFDGVGYADRHHRRQRAAYRRQLRPAGPADRRVAAQP